ncbi:Gfo/Idh/MocA family oxidoreductase [Geomonas paludis]|uniref:Oxidoreductase n=1 Tax=Geomonas paludis TaxID=2740185 RepID=A0A6V8MV62_9BACT|nr:Gfo/Idh/MocA family oxidoreductase [Geomonas paludis]UPU37700.1 Gfo/Idh/MocA family oxidoreductase [Geomonas paludis]GFO63764.1 oxidoreductase [Geomonas paludis]
MKRKQALPRLGFLGTGWIGRHRMEAIVKSGEAEVAAIADLCPENAQEAGKLAPGAPLVESLEELLELDLDGVVIATPSAGHCYQALRALDRGLAVFCQKPLGRNAEEAQLVVGAARAVNRLLGVDFSYRYTDAIQKMHQLVTSGELGQVYAADLVFHNAYGPDKDWFYDPELSGGGCLMDLGSHLIDLALWFFNYPEVRSVSSSIFAGGERLKVGSGKVEDYAVVSLVLEDGHAVRLACSWNVSAGRDAVIESSFYGTHGGVSFKNVQGSFYDFVAERFRGTASETIAAPPDEWGGRCAVAWARQLRLGGNGFDPQAEQLVRVAEVLDAAYGR